MNSVISNIEHFVGNPLKKSPSTKLNFTATREVIYMYIYVIVNDLAILLVFFTFWYYVVGPKNLILTSPHFLRVSKFQVIFSANTHPSSFLFVSQTVKVLLKFDANPNLANDKGTTSIDICKDDKILKLLTTTEVKADIEKSHAVAEEKEDGGEAQREEEVEKCHDDGIKTGAESFPPPSSPKTETEDVSDMDTEQVLHKAKLEVAATLSPPTSGPMSLENVPPSAGASHTAVGRKGGRGRFRGRRTKGGFYSDISSSESESDYFEAGSKRRRRKGLLVERQTQRSLEGVSESQEETDEEVETRTGVDEEGKGKGRDKAEKSEEMEGVEMVAEEAGKDEQESIMTEKNKDEKKEKKDVKEEEKSEKEEEGEKEEEKVEKDEEKKSEKDVEKEGEKEEEKEGEKEEKKDVNDEETLDEHHEIGTMKSDSGQELKKGPDKMKEMEGSSAAETSSSKLFSWCVDNCVCIIIVLL